MEIHIQADSNNTLTVLDLLERQGFSLPCNCHGANVCGGVQYDFPCGMVPKAPLTVHLPDATSSAQITGLSLMQTPDLSIQPDSLLIDIGTTTIAMVYYHSTKKSTLFSEVFANPQIAYGADVISRIQYDVTHPSEHTLHKELTASLTGHAASFLKRYPDISIKQCLIGGNTTMIHLLLNLSLQGMTGHPFTPEIPDNFSFTHKGVSVHVLPWLSAFIGGDITAGLLSLSFDTRNDTCILADLGTNGELVLCHKNHLYTASTAAGPALEGGGLSHGCPAIPGAVSEVSLRGIIPRIQTIANKLPCGICGIGAISVLAELLSQQYMNADGTLTSKFPENGILLAKAPSSDIIFTSNDVRQMQLAVAAIAAGIDTLCREAGILPENVDSLYLAGGLGYHIPLEKASSLGMFCDILPERIHCVGNSCLNGLAKLSSAAEEDFISLQHRLTAQTENISLADNAFFQSSYLSHMTYHLS